MWLKSGAIFNTPTARYRLHLGLVVLRLCPSSPHYDHTRHAQQTFSPMHPFIPDTSLERVIGGIVT